MTQRGVLWDWAKVREWERENVFNSCPTHSHPHLTSCLCPPCHLSCWQMKWPCSLMSQRFVLLHTISAVTLLSPCIIDGFMKMYSQQICLFFFHKPSNKISDLRSAETSPVKSSTEFQHLIIFSAVIACRCFAYQLGCCCFMFTHISRSPCLIITMGYCYSCLLCNFHFHIPNNQYFKLLDDQNTFKTF